MLIRNAEIAFSGIFDVRIAGGKIVEIAEGLAPGGGQDTIDARGSALLPGLHDHHIHLLAYAASLESVRCGPPLDADALVRALRHAPRVGPSQWIRGIGYHESVAGEIDRAWLDAAVLEAPVRIQHRGGRLWVLNSRALKLIATASNDTPLESKNGVFTGRLYDGDRWLREQIGSSAPSLSNASRFLASRGVTGVTDAGPANSSVEMELFASAIARGDVIQKVLLMGGAGLDRLADTAGVQRGSTKIHLLEAALPPFDDLVARMTQSHRISRTIAVHCVTLTELIFTLAAFEESGTLPGDRIEHAGVVPLDVLPRIAELGLTVVTQPNFIAERGESYLRDVEPEDQPSLYRLRSILNAGIPLAGGTDAPFGGADPWAAMEAATTRLTKGGFAIGPEEALTPEQAVALFLGNPLSPGRECSGVAVGADADLCLLDRSWRKAREGLSEVKVAITVKSGKIVWPNLVD
jgi:predicted amidohydrolase YtcJ